MVINKIENWKIKKYWYAKWNGWEPLLYVLCEMEMENRNAAHNMRNKIKRLYIEKFNEPSFLNTESNSNRSASHEHRPL